MKTNALQEFKQFISVVSGSADIACASINHVDMWNTEIAHECILPLEYTQEQWDDFLKELDFTYDSGYGGQELFGTIWFTNGTWATRREYDGSEWWEYHSCPEIPKHLRQDTYIEDEF